MAAAARHAAGVLRYITLAAFETFAEQGSLPR